jgi:hypothetical protein
LLVTLAERTNVAVWSWTCREGEAVVRVAML